MISENLNSLYSEAQIDVDVRITKYKQILNKAKPPNRGHDMSNSNWPWNDISFALQITYCSAGFRDESFPPTVSL